MAAELQLLQDEYLATHYKIGDGPKKSGFIAQSWGQMSVLNTIMDQLDADASGTSQRPRNSTHLPALKPTALDAPSEDEFKDLLKQNKKRYSSLMSHMANPSAWLKGNALPRAKQCSHWRQAGGQPYNGGLQTSDTSAMFHAVLVWSANAKCVCVCVCVCVIHFWHQHEDRPGQTGCSGGRSKQGSVHHSGMAMMGTALLQLRIEGSSRHIRPPAPYHVCG